MKDATALISEPKDFWLWLIDTLDQIPNPRDRSAEFLFDISSDTWEKYKSVRIDIKENAARPADVALPDSKHLEKIVMSRAFERMSSDDRETLVRTWAHLAMLSAGRGTAPSDDFIEFFAFILRKCPPKLLEKGVKEVRELDA